jgi:ribonucleotide monophosphatase NagD (HAD superfamily)
MVGDSLHHDIHGASTSGIASVFICGGIHADDLGLQSLGAMPEEDRLKALLKKEDARPTFVAPMFQW